MAGQIATFKDVFDCSEFTKETHIIFNPQNAYTADQN